MGIDAQKVLKECGSFRSYEKCAKLTNARKIFSMRAP